MWLNIFRIINNKVNTWKLSLLYSNFDAPCIICVKLQISTKIKSLSSTHDHKNVYKIYEKNYGKVIQRKVTNYGAGKNDKRI